MKIEKGGLFFIDRLLIIIQCNFLTTLSFTKRDHTKTLLKKNQTSGKLNVIHHKTASVQRLIHF